MEKSIEEQGLLDEADAKAIAQIEAFLEALDPDLNLTIAIGMVLRLQQTLKLK